MTCRPRRPAPRLIDRAAHAICERVATCDGRCGCKAAGGPACSAMVLTAIMVARRLMNEADEGLLREVIDGTADL